MENLIMQMGELMENKTNVSVQKLDKNIIDYDKLAEDNKRLEKCLIQLQRKLEERDSLEKEMTMQYKEEINNLKRNWIPIIKHEEIVNEELIKQERELIKTSS